MEPPAFLLPLGLACACCVFGATFLYLAQRYLRQRRAVHRLERAEDGERRAPAWLERLGYRVIGAQVSCTYPVYVDGAQIDVALRADYLVEREGLRYVAEVKTGACAPRIQTPATRRQLLEYRVAFDVDGVLLVDAESGRVHAVSFPLAKKHADRREFFERFPVLPWLAAVAIIAGVLAAARAYR